MDRWNEIAVQLWCLPANAKKEMDADFALSIGDALRAAYQEGLEEGWTLGGIAPSEDKGKL